MKITGTFIDEITHDIPSSNWGEREWEADFQAMKYIGIDTVIIIRNGYRNLATFNSKVLSSNFDMINAPIDLLELFLSLSDKYGINLFFGTYDSGKYWMNGDYQREVDINKAFTEEVNDKYGHHPSFQGWYISHEIDTYNPDVMNVYRQLGNHLKGLRDIPILISPYIHGKKQFAEDPTSLEQHKESWDKVFAEIRDCVDIVAFQDGNVDYAELYDYLLVNSKLAKKYQLTGWTNVETFDRDVLIKFPPINWPALCHKMDAATRSGVDKMITFEFSHFMSPFSIYPAARHLYDRYCESVGLTPLNAGVESDTIRLGEILSDRLENSIADTSALSNM
ncbi:hypothetical protein L21SP3_02084 [Sedimentisphaera cyanobacteriorum]|uniref:DUF4434 domain-containing protein n=1 Tax=Sedimentisphaera cyanobacteriorum TaxID=1940790 RepID=A0A1Q2HSL7_9BACT|nr:DUF4434 domain-containing protein [Sedimentisphaera cyanobacteriorum]AQQ10256.1 hypothetical protein L21SP3_02084 [Sedimentisphaera cyanobacteriorum]